jgi:inorganic pyrophosphatase
MSGFERIPIGDKAPYEVNTIVEVPKGSSNKYKFNKPSDSFRYDHTLYSPLYYPYDYGWICGTMREQDAHPLSCLVVASNPTFVGCLITARPIGAMIIQDANGADNKILCVAVSDPRFASVVSLADLSSHSLLEVQHFFEIYQALEQNEVKIEGWEDAGPTKNRIVAAMSRYNDLT